VIPFVLTLLLGIGLGQLRSQPAAPQTANYKTGRCAHLGGN
jgi:hypothetical protein